MSVTERSHSDEFDASVTERSQGSTIGIDVSVNHPAFALYPERKTVRLKTKGRGAERLYDLHRKTYYWMVENAPGNLTGVYMEAPWGPFDKKALDHASGVIQAAVLVATRSMFHDPVPFTELTPGEWKLLALGRGNAKKDDAIRWAAEQGVEATEDECEALCVAYAGHELLRAEGE